MRLPRPTMTFKSPTDRWCCSDMASLVAANRFIRILSSFGTDRLNYQYSGILKIEYTGAGIARAACPYSP